MVRFEHEPLGVLEPLGRRQLPPPGLPVSEHLLLLDARTVDGGDLSVQFLEPRAGRALLDLQNGAQPARAEATALLASGLAIRGPTEDE